MIYSRYAKLIFLGSCSTLFAQGKAWELFSFSDLIEQEFQGDIFSLM